MQEQNKYVYDLVNKWIENADNKVNVSCAVVTGVFTAISFLVGNSEKVVEFYTSWGCLYKIFQVLSLLFMFISIWYFFAAINPNLGSNGAVQNAFPIKEKDCLLFYGDIAKLKLEDYKERTNRADEKVFIDELQNEIHYNSRICTSKMKRYKNGLRCSFVAVAFLFLQLVIKLLLI